jgi:hypothetical protein
MRTVRKTDGVYKCVVCGEPSPDQNKPHKGKCSCYSQNTRASSVEKTDSGPGTELKKLLKTIGITATPNCSCNARARTMDANGCDWCEDNIDTIVGWLREEAAKRGLPFLDAAGRLLVRRAIRNARKAAS